MGWQKNGELTPQGERLAERYASGERGSQLEKQFPGRTGSALERKARLLIEKYNLAYEEDDDVETLELIETRLKEPRVLYVDIETTNFGADFGVITMMGYQWSDEEEPSIMTCLDYEQREDLPPHQRDKELVQDIIDLINKADVVSGHYSDGSHFDLGFITARAAYHRLHPPQEIDHLDTFSIAKRAFGKGLRSRRLKNLAVFLELTEQKDEMTKWEWYDAMHGWEPALRRQMEYCMQDVATQKALLEAILPYARQQNIPGFQVLNNKETLCCVNPMCGSDDIERVGWKHTRVMKYPRYKCNDCGKNMRGRHSVFDRNTSRLTD